MRRPLLDRFREKVEIGKKLKSGKSMNVGNGKLPVAVIDISGIKANSQKVVCAHRVSWVFYHGRLIPKGLVIIHTCHNKKCVNPHHLKLGTHDDNMKDIGRRNRILAIKMGHEIL